MFAVKEMKIGRNFDFERAYTRERWSYVLFGCEPRLGTVSSADSRGAALSSEQGCGFSRVVGACSQDNRKAHDVNHTSTGYEVSRGKFDKPERGEWPF